jgi:hypothetical protein
MACPPHHRLCSSAAARFRLLPSSNVPTTPIPSTPVLCLLESFLPSVYMRSCLCSSSIDLLPLIYQHRSTLLESFLPSPTHALRTRSASANSSAARPPTPLHSTRVATAIIRLSPTNTVPPCPPSPPTHAFGYCHSSAAQLPTPLPFHSTQSIVLPRLTRSSSQLQRNYYMHDAPSPTVSSRASS